MKENELKNEKERRIGALLLTSFLILAALIGLTLVAEEASAAGEMVTIDNPTEGMTLYGGIMDLNLTVTNFVLDPSAIGQANVPGEGHWHLYINDQLMGPYAVEDIQLTDLPAGDHKIEVELVNNDHSSLDPKVSDVVNITVAYPMIHLMHPMEGQIQYKDSLDLHVMVENFTMNESAVGQDIHTPGEGHYHIFINSELVGPETDMMVLLEDLPAGNHMIEVELVNNDHSSLVPKAYDMANFTIVDANPEIMLKYPMHGQINYNDDMEVEVMISNFTMNASAIGMEKMVSEGHYHIYINDVLVGPYTDMMVLLEDLPAGDHVMKVELVNNDHSPLIPPAYDMADFTIVNSVPSIEILSPMDDSILYKDSLDLEVSIMGLEMNASAIGGENMVGEGHYHIYINDALVGPFTDTMVTLEDLPAGDHILKVQLNNNDHTPVIPEVIDMIEFTIVGDIPTIMIESPVNGTVIYDDMLQLEVNVTNFILNSTSIGLSNVAGEGHYHLYINDELIDPYTDMMVLLTELPAGDHVLKVELSNNDHSTLMGDMEMFMDMIHFTISEIRPEIHIMHPMDMGVYYSDSLDVHVDIMNFTMNGSAIGGDNMIGEGHYHIYINDVLVGPFNETMVTLTDLPAGDHVLKVAIVNNDHSYIHPMVMDMVHFTLSDSRPMIDIVKPMDGDFFYGGDLTVEVSIDGFLMNASAIGGNNTVGEGHWHLYINGDLIGPYTSSIVALNDLPAGHHELKVMLVNNDHSPVMPEAMDMLMFHLLPVPAIEITSPENGTVIEGTTLELEVEVTDFILSASAVGEANMAGEGHYHIYINDDLVGPYTDLMVMLEDLPAGDHVLKVELKNNDHSGIGVEAMDMLYFTISIPPTDITVTFGPVLFDGEPLEGATVMIMSGEMEYEATTGQNGIATFTLPADWEGGSVDYVVVKDGYKDLEGSGTIGMDSISVTGDVEMEEEEEEDQMFIWIILIVLVIVVVIAIFIMMRSKGKEDQYIEE